MSLLIMGYLVFNILAQAILAPLEMITAILHHNTKMVNSNTQYYMYVENLVITLIGFPAYLDNLEFCHLLSRSGISLKSGEKNLEF